MKRFNNVAKEGIVNSKGGVGVGCGGPTKGIWTNTCIKEFELILVLVLPTYFCMFDFAFPAYVGVSMIEEYSVLDE